MRTFLFCLALLLFAGCEPAPKVTGTQPSPLETVRQYIEALNAGRAEDAEGLTSKHHSAAKKERATEREAQAFAWAGGVRQDPELDLTLHGPDTAVVKARLTMHRGPILRRTYTLNREGEGGHWRIALGTDGLPSINRRTSATGTSDG